MNFVAFAHSAIPLPLSSHASTRSPHTSLSLTSSTFTVTRPLTKSSPSRSRSRLPTRCCQRNEQQHPERDDSGSDTDDMAVWNSVIHASLKRKLHTLISEENPVTSGGVSSLLNNTYNPTPSSSFQSQSQKSPSQPIVTADKSPDDVVRTLLATFKRDALLGATAFVSFASSNCHVKHTNPQTLLLFIGDNESYRPLLRLSSFNVAAPRYESSLTKCVVTVDLHLPDVSAEETAKFDFQLSLDNTDSANWLIDEVFRL